MLISSAGLRRLEAACEHARGGGAPWRVLGVQRLTDQTEVLETANRCPTPLHTWVGPRSLWVGSIALAEAWDGGQHRGRSIHEWTLPPPSFKATFIKCRVCRYVCLRVRALTPKQDP